MCREQRVCEADRDYLFQQSKNRRGVQKWEPLNRRGQQFDMRCTALRYGRKGVCFSQNHAREGVGGPAVQPHIPVLFRT